MEKVGCPKFDVFYRNHFKRQQVKAGLGGIEDLKKRKRKKTAVIDYFAGKVSQITRPFILKTTAMQTLNS